MNKKRTLGYITYLIFLVIFHLIVFTVVKSKINTFWINYGFTFLSFLILPFIWEWTLGRNKNLKSKFLGFPVLYICFIYFSIQMVLFIVLVSIPRTPLWATLLLNSINLLVGMVLMISAEIGKDEISRIDSKIQQKRSFLLDLKLEVDVLSRFEKNTEIKKALEELFEKIKFSDPISVVETKDIEQKIQQKVLELSQSEEKEIVQLVKEIEVLLFKRNKVVLNTK